MFFHPLFIINNLFSHSTYNYIGCHVNKLVSAFEKGDLVQARSIQVLVCCAWLLRCFWSDLFKHLSLFLLLFAVQNAGASELRHETWWVMLVKLDLLEECSCFYILSCFALIDRLWCRSQQAADVGAVGFISGTPSTPPGAMSSWSHWADCSEISHSFFLTRWCLIFLVNFVGNPFVDTSHRTSTLLQQIINTNIN